MALWFQCFTRLAVSLSHHISFAVDSFPESGVLQRHSSGGEAAAMEGAEDIHVGDTGL